MKQQSAAQPASAPVKPSAKKRPAPVTETDLGAAAKAAPTSTRAALGGWLEGPKFDGDLAEGEYRGKRLGLPENGRGALAGQGRRLGALCVDWAVAYLIALAFGWRPTTAAGQWGVIGVFAVEHLLLLSTLGFTVGKRLFGTQVGRLGGPLTPLAVICRTALLLLVIPAAIWDKDGRGLHDRLVGTVEVLR